ncbi:MAG: thioesterase family protein [Gemmatimonadaceae bacterium]
MAASNAHRLTSDVEFRVRYAETDQMGVVYHSHYLVWCEIGRTDLIRRLGTPYAELEKQGVVLAVVDASIRYHLGARYDDLVRVRTLLSGVRSRSITFDYTVERVESGAKLVTARTTLASLNREGKLVALPSPLRTLLEDALR